MIENIGNILIMNVDGGILQFVCCMGLAIVGCLGGVFILRLLVVDDVGMVVVCVI